MNGDYEAVIFDMNGVLMNSAAMWKGTDWEMQNGIPAGSLMRVLFSEQFRRQSKTLFSGAISAETFDSTIFQALFEQIVGKSYLDGRRRQSFHVLSDWYPSDPTQGVVFEEMMRAVKLLKRRGYGTALLTNNYFIDDAKQKPTVHVDTSNFDVVVESCRLGICKPDERIYKFTLDRLEVPAEKSIFIDDSKTFCDAASRLGITTIHVNKGDTDAALKQLEELLNVPLR
ncbi:unnamed protein product [Anisakis simplex]|uniref:Acyl-CoA dehydrogenase family member 10 (inferred by orthology to a human protein) n=1 Tax=Anisakis simplex TaxID=6269 RepID=A0A0M3K0M5_ANISI|nr:unnamed protein product [Anisakis simplex]